MFDALNDAQLAHEHCNTLMQAAEQHRLRRSLPPQQPKLFVTLQSQVAELLQQTRTQQNRTQRA